ncbi:MAG: arsenate reductase family protein [Gemmatimonadota bacterium]
MRGRRAFAPFTSSLQPPAFSLSVEVQIFGTQKSQDTRRALRFWSERRVKVHFVDLKERAASKGELQRFVQKFGLTALIDKTSKRYQDLGLGVARLSDDRWLTLLTEEPLLLAQPLTRWGGKLTLGVVESDWTAWIAAERGT